ncbi:hypothetical protein [Herbaspirillum rubrisubalbicans]|uniref:hypothetical protein n=1 Tax=Herbaspirillum rubrisubalbicans TaxID=80842 RepID=UPI0011D1FF1E|nr:hypothetical protein [Herbaspirillum rubrisubalbicans]
MRAHQVKSPCLLFCFDIHIAGFVPAQKERHKTSKPLILNVFLKTGRNPSIKPVRIPGMLLRRMSDNPSRRATPHRRPMKNGACLATCAVERSSQHPTAINAPRSHP